MEESIKKSKEKVEENKKLTYEQLENVANNLNSQCKQLYDKLCEAQEIIAGFNDVGLLLSIIDKSEYFESAFITRCVDKIQTTMGKMLDKSDELEKSKEEN